MIFELMMSSTGHEFKSSITRGFGWHVGGQIARSLPLGVCILIAVCVLGYFGYKALNKR